MVLMVILRPASYSHVLKDTKRLNQEHVPINLYRKRHRQEVFSEDLQEDERSTVLSRTESLSSFDYRNSMQHPQNAIHFGEYPCS